MPEQNKHEQSDVEVQAPRYEGVQLLGDPLHLPDNVLHVGS